MRKCNNCNIILGDADNFCPNCGMTTVPVQQEKFAEPAQPVEPAGPAQIAAPVQPETPVQPSPEPYRNPAGVKKPAKKKKTGLIIGIIAAVALLAVAAVVIASLFKNKPMVQFYNAQNRFMTTSVRGSSIDDVLRGKADGINTEISTDAVLRVAAEGLDIMGLDIIDKFDISFNIDTRGDEDLFSVGVNYKGSPVLTGTIKSTENDLYCYLPELSEEYYVVDRNLLLGLMDMGELDTEPVDYEKVENLSRAYDDVKSRYDAILRTGVAEEDFSAEKGVVRLAGLEDELKNASTIIYRPNKDRLTAMFTKLGEEIKDDEALSNYLLSLFDYYFANKSGTVFSAADYESDEERNLKDALRELGENLQENAAEIANNIAESEFEWRCVTDDGSIIAQYITGKDFSFTFEQPDDLRSYLRCEPANGEGAVTVTRTLEKTGSTIGGDIRFETEGSGMNFTGKLTITSMDEKTKSAFGVPYGSYKLDVTLTDEDDSFGSRSLSLDINVGAKDGGGTEHRLTVNGLSDLIDDDEIPDSITVFLDTTDQDSTVRAPSADPTRISNEEEFQSAVSDLSDSLMTVLYRLMLRISLSGD
ncbi:MAG: hypothetical protein IKO51_09210 [Clostridia bacterium]|nr:hypothetical protein [Clostridia bacterium]